MFQEKAFEQVSRVYPRMPKGSGWQGLLVHGWDSIKHLSFYSLLSLSTLKHDKVLRVWWV